MAKMIPLRQMLTEAEESNMRLGHENLGCLSEQHGFLPTSPPLQSLPENYRIWDETAAQLPELISTLRLRRVVDQLPFLDATVERLPDQYLCRAALLLCNIAHAYYWLEVGSTKTPPDSIIQAWTQVSQRLGRPHPSLLSLDVLYNWKLRNPLRIDPFRVDNIEILAPVTGVQAERIEYQSAVELMLQTVPVIAAVVKAHEAMVVNDEESLQQALLQILERIEHITEVTYAKIDLNPHSANYVNPSIWGKVAGGGYFSGPIHPNELGMSGAGYPIFALMDIFLGRKTYTSKKGQEALAVRHWYPWHLRRFFSALEKISLRDFVLTHASPALRNIFQQLLDVYASDKGFLGLHRLKTYGFMEVGFKTGRAVTNGGFKSLNVFKEKTWDNINDELEIARNERYKGLPTHSYFAIARQNEKLEGGSKKEIRKISFDIEGSHIHYQPGDRCGILPENSAELIEKTICALRAKFDTPVELHPPWQAALQLRASHQNQQIKQHHISLYEFLKFAKIRPVTRNIAKRLFTITAATDLERILHAHAEDQWELWDFFAILSRGGFDVQRFWRARAWEKEALCRILPPETFRLYSIASSATKKRHQNSPEMLQLTVGQLSYTTLDSAVSTAGKRMGTASNYLHRLTSLPSNKTSRVSLRIVPAHRFRLPTEHTQPIVMFAAGTGIAPFFGFIEERARQNAADNWLFFSTQTRSQFHNQQWLVEKISDGHLNLRVAFSRQDITTRYLATPQGGKLVFEHGERCRIDNLIFEEKNARILWKLLRTRQNGGLEACFYICGKTGFASTVIAALKKLIRQFSRKTENEVNQFIYHLNAHRRLMMDIFTTYSVPATAENRMFSVTEVAVHNSEATGYWMSLNGRVYDLTEFIQMHPGGHQTLLLNCGVDASKAYRSVGHSSSPEVEAMLGMYEIGRLKRLNFGSTGGLAIGPDGPFFILLDEVFRVWTRYLYLIIEMQNALKIDLDFLQQATTASEFPQDFSLFKMQLFIQAQKRFKDHYLDVLTGEDLQVLWAITSGLCSHKADVRWMQNKLKKISTRYAHHQKQCVSLLQDKLDIAKNHEHQSKQTRAHALSSLKILHIQIIKENEDVLETFKKVICDGVKIFEHHESEVIALGGQLLLKQIMKIPWFLQNYYEQIGRDVVAPHTTPMKTILGDIAPSLLFEEYKLYTRGNYDLGATAPKSQAPRVSFCAKKGD